MKMIMEKKLLFPVMVLVFLFLALEGLGYYIGNKRTSMSEAGIKDKKTARISVPEIKEKNRALKSMIKSLSPGGVYIVVDTARNLLFLKEGERTIREAVISSGSGNILYDAGGKKKWVFDTPRGEYTVKSKYISPAWTKPDWAFVEEGEDIPKKYSDRIENGVLGDYALGFGNGYFIHGTLYTRLLGRNVTHGCIRVGDKDLRAVFMAAEIGTRIFIF